MNAQGMFGVDGSPASVPASQADDYLDAIDYLRRCRMAVDIARERESSADLDRAELAYRKARVQLNGILQGSSSGPGASLMLTRARCSVTAR